MWLKAGITRDITIVALAKVLCVIEQRPPGRLDAAIDQIPLDCRQQVCRSEPLAGSRSRRFRDVAQSLDDLSPRQRCRMEWMAQAPGAATCNGG